MIAICKDFTNSGISGDAFPVKRGLLYHHELSEYTAANSPLLIFSRRRLKITLQYCNILFIELHKISEAMQLRDSRITKSISKRLLPVVPTEQNAKR